MKPKPKSGRDINASHPHISALCPTCGTHVVQEKEQATDWKEPLIKYLQLLQEEMNPNQLQDDHVDFITPIFRQANLCSNRTQTRAMQTVDWRFSEAEGCWAPLLPNAEAASASVDIQSATQVHLERSGFPSAL